jgi:hypothetical protein
VFLSRLGDIINIIPAIHQYYLGTGIKPAVLSGKQFINIFDGCSYVEQIPYDGLTTKNGLDAVSWFKKTHKHTGYNIINCSYYRSRKYCNTFLREAWDIANCGKPFGTLPLVFDNRSKEREQDLLRFFNVDSKPILLLSLNGHSSPFNNRNNLKKQLEEELKEFQIIDISDAKAERFYDLLTLYEKAHALITIDTATLHLAQATPELKVIALISDLNDEWHQSDWKPNHALRLLYSQVMNNVNKIVKAVREPFRQRKIYLVSSAKYQIPADTWQRYEFALNSWLKVNYKELWEYLPVYSDNVPKVKNLINEAEKKALSDDIILITNADISFHPSITDFILDKVPRYGSVYLHRHDFARLDKHFISESEIRLGKWYCGSDAFAFTKQWWIHNRNIMPDMYFGREAWDMIFRNVVKRSGGGEIHNAIYHQKHASYWEQNRNDEINIYNRNLANEWLDKYANRKYWNEWKINRNQLVYK